MKLIYRNIMALLALVIVIASCTVGKKYVRDNVEMPAQFRANIPVTADSVQLPWKIFFKEPVLVDLIQNALDKNNDIGIALKSIEQLDLAVKQAKMEWLPALDINAGASRAWLSKNSLNGSLSQQFVGTSYMDDYTTSLQLTWELDIWGKAKMQQRAAVANYFAQKENLSALKTRIISQVAQAYYNLVTLDEQLNIAKENIALSDSTLRIMRLQYRAGQINSLAVGQMEAQKKNAELLVPMAMQNIAAQENALSILCGRYPDAVKRSKDVTGIKYEQQLAIAVPAQLLSRRPDVKAAEYAVVTANAQTGLAKAAMYPSFSLVPQAGTNSFKFNKWFDLPGSMAKTLAVNMAQPIFKKGALKTDYQKAAIEQEKAVINYRQVILTAVGEVSDAMVKSNSAGERIILIDQKKQLLDKVTGDAMILYKNGMATYLEVITAQNNRLQNDLELINTRLEQFTATTDLYRALGGGID